MRGVYHGGAALSGATSNQDSYPADRLSAVFGGGMGIDGSLWSMGTASLFQATPANPLVVGGACDFRVASSPHPAGINVALADGSVRFVSGSIDPNNWWAGLTPSGGETLGLNQ
jgi:prepilin-type processing-associated H-X9-DG protein